MLLRLALRLPETHPRRSGGVGTTGRRGGSASETIEDLVGADEDACDDKKLDYVLALTGEPFDYRVN